MAKRRRKHRKHRKSTAGKTCFKVCRTRRRDGTFGK